MQWRRPRLRTAALVLGVLVWVVLLGSWLAFGRPTSWREWLSDFRMSAAGSTGSHGNIGHRTEGGADLSYFGNGTAELGDYSIRIFDPVAGTTFRTDFQLEGQTVCADEAAFKDFMKNNYRFFREQVMVTLRNCDSADLVDPDYRLLEKKLASRVNRALGRRFLESAKIKNFVLYESFDKSGFVPSKPSRKTTGR